MWDPKEERQKGSQSRDIIKDIHESRLPGFQTLPSRNQEEAILRCIIVFL